MTRPAVHTASAHRLGASDPRQEGPGDYRLVPPALAAWAAAALMVAAPGWWAVTAVVATVCGAGAVLAFRRVPVRSTVVAAALLCAAAGRPPAGCKGPMCAGGPSLLWPASTPRSTPS